MKNRILRSRNAIQWLTFCFMLLVASGAVAETPGQTIATFGKHSEKVEDMRVKVLGGDIRVTREWSGNSWSINRRWQPVSQNWETTYHCKGYYDEFGTWHASVGCEVDQYFSGFNRSGVLYNQNRGSESTTNGTVLTRWATGVAPGNYFLVETKPGSDNTVENAPVFVSVRWVNTTGEWLEYAPTGTGSFRPSRYGDKNEVAVTLHHDAVGRETGVSDHNGKQILWYEYDTEGNVSLIKDYSGRQVKYGYTGGNLTSVTDVRAQVWTYEYDEKGRLSRKTDPNNHSTAIEYTSAGTVTAITYPDETTRTFKYEYDKTKKEYYKQEKSPAGVVTETWYNDDGEFLRQSINSVQVKRIEREEGKRSEIGQDGNTTVRFEDAYGNVTKTLWPDGSFNTTEYLGTTSYPTKKVDENGVVTLFEYDAKRNLTKLTEAAGRAEQRITTYTYDEYGNPLTRTVQADSVSVAVTEKYGYDEFGNLTSYTDGEGNTTTFTHDVMGNILTITNHLNHVLGYSYDAAGNLLTMTDLLGRTTALEYDKAGQLVKSIEPGNLTSTLEYDANGRLLRATEPGGATSQIGYDADGRPLSVTNTGVTQHLKYDTSGRLVETVDGSENAIVINYLSGKINGSGEIGTVQYPTFQSTLGYDKQGRVNRLTRSADNKSYSSQAEYDIGNGRETVTDAKGRTSQYHYDGLGRLVESVDTLNQSTKYTYDNRDNIISVTNAKSVVIRRFEYDRSNRVTKKYRPDGTFYSYSYDDSNNTITRIDAKGQKAVYYHNSAEQLERAEYYSDTTSSEPKRRITFTYNEQGKLSGYNDGTTSASYTYDTLGRKSSEAVNYGPFSLSYSYSYDALGRKTSFFGPDGTTVNYGYDEAGRPATVSIPDSGTFAYSAYNWLVPSRFVMPGGSVEELNYDGLMRTVQHSYTDPAGTSLLNEQYSYDEVGNILGKSTGHGNYSFNYDELNRLLSADNPNIGDEAYTYDAVGNRKTDTRTEGEWQYSDDDQLTAYGKVTQSYDANGSLIEKNANGVITKYRYNLQNRLSEVQDGRDNLIASYYYDPYGRRLWKEVAGVRTYFLYAEEGLIAEADASGNITRQFGWRPGGTWGTNPLYLKSGGQTYYYINDDMGTPQKLVTASGAVVWSAEYEAFGKGHVGLAQVDNPLRFPGQYLDGETGLHYNLFRYYDPATGRYTKIDPIGLVGNINTYLYAAGNPMMFSDPFGLEEFERNWFFDLIIDSGAGDYITQDVVDFSAGFGDTISFGLTDKIRDWNGTNSAVNKCSGAYGAGEWGGVVYGAVAGGAVGWRMAGKKAAGLEYSHWVPARAKKMGIFKNRYGKWFLRKGNRWNGNYVSNLRHYKHDPFRYSKRKGEWADWGEKWPSVIQQLDRVPNVYKGTAIGGGATGAKSAGGACGCE